VHSYEQIIASSESAGRATPQRSHADRISSMTPLSDADDHVVDASVELVGRVVDDIALGELAAD
jgi:hypothetical protein